MTKAAVLLTAVLAAASVGVFAQDSSQSASAPPQVSSQSTNTSATVPTAVAPASAAQSEAPESAQADDPQGSEVRSAKQLPQTSTFLPLLGLIGLGSLVAGLFARR
jgi:hypothetical protein